MIQTHYLIVGYPRTGTTAIHFMLRGHPQISVLEGELEISPFFTQGMKTFVPTSESIEQEHAGFLKLFDTLTTLSADKPITTSGAKSVCRSPIQAQCLVHTLQKHLPNLKIILIKRKNIVAQYGSWIHAQQSGVWHAWKPEQTFQKKISQLTMNKWLLIRYTINCLKTYNILQELRNSHALMECTFEDLLAGQESINRTLFGFLQVSQPKEISWIQTKKVMPEPASYIRNYNEMQNVVEQLKTQYEDGQIPLLITILAKLHGRFWSLCKSPHAIL